MTNGNVVVKIELEKKRHCFSAIQFCKRTTPLYPKLRLGGGGGGISHSALKAFVKFKT